VGKPRRFHFAVLHDYVLPRTVILLAVALILAFAFHPLIRSLYRAGLERNVLVVLILVAILTVAMINLLLIAWDKGNIVSVNEESLGIVIRRPNASPVHLTIMWADIAAVREVPPAMTTLPSSIQCDEQSGTLMLYRNPWGDNIELGLRTPKAIRYSELKRMLVPRLHREEYVFATLIIGASNHEECLEAIRASTGNVGKGSNENR